MEKIIAIIMLSLIAGFYTLRFYFLKRNIKNAASQLQKITENPETNQILLITYPGKEIESFLEVVNEFITSNRKSIIRLGRKEKELRTQIENISHDLRTPLTAIIGYLELLDMDGMCEDDQLMMASIKKKAGALQTLISNFYDLSRLEMKDYHLHMEKVDLLRFIKETALLSYQEFEQKGLEVELLSNQEQKTWISGMPDYNILADRGAMERIFNNMLQNALRYAKSYFHIYITKTEQIVNLSFVNDCTSLKPEDAEHIFERFFVKEKSRTSQSTGLGLTINKLLTEAMSGTVEAKVTGDELTITYHFASYN